jgi:hypothetical protein
MGDTICDAWDSMVVNNVGDVLPSAENIFIGRKGRWWERDLLSESYTIALYKSNIRRYFNNLIYKAKVRVKSELIS